MNSEHRQRKSSLERYQPKRNESDELSDTLNSLSLNGQQDQQNHIPTKHVKSNNKPRRGVNSHLYGNNQQDSRASQGRGRGRGSNRGPPHQNQQDKTTFSSSFSPDNEEKQQDHHQQTQSWGQRSSSDRGANITFQATNASSRHRQSNHQTRNEMNQIDRNYHNKASKRNTETFKPSHKPAEMRILCAPESWMKYSREVQSRDVIIVNGLFCQPDDLSLYEKLLSEIKTSGIDQEDLWKLWHGDSHVIADDKLKWKEACPTFHLVLHKIQEYFEMDIKGIIQILGGKSLIQNFKSITLQINHAWCMHAGLNQSLNLA